MKSESNWTEPVISEAENTGSDGHSRRSFLGKAAVGVGVAGATWAAPSVVSSRAYAQGSCAPCPPGPITVPGLPYGPVGGGNNTGAAWSGTSIIVCIPDGASSVTVQPTDAGLIFDEAVTFAVGGQSASYSSYQLNCVTPPATKIAAGEPSIDITALFGGPALACGEFPLTISHCNGSGPSRVSNFEILVT